MELYLPPYRTPEEVIKAKKKAESKVMMEEMQTENVEKRREILLGKGTQIWDG